MNIWLDPPDRVRIDAALEKFVRPVWDPYVEFIRGALAEEHTCVVREQGVTLENRIDDLMVRTFYLASETDPRFRDQIGRLA